jgi:hypothetical protein
MGERGRKVHKEGYRQNLTIRMLPNLLAWLKTKGKINQYVEMLIQREYDKEIELKNLSQQVDERLSQVLDAENILQVEKLLKNQSDLQRDINGSSDNCNEILQN